MMELPLWVCTFLFNDVWEKLYDTASEEQLIKLGNGQALGMSHDVETYDSVNYLAGYQIDNENKARELGLDVVKVEPAEYAVVDVNGPVPSSIEDAWKNI